MKKVIFILSVIVCGIALNSCNNDDDDSGTLYPYSVRMTDAPGPYDAVNIDLKSVEVIGGDGQAVTLNTEARIYNLLELSNGVDALIATSFLTNASVKQVRLILGTNNSVVINNVSYPLSTPSADQSGLKIQVNQVLNANASNDILLDFDANQSIVLEGNGTYKLKPVLRTINATASASGVIKGSISPIGTLVAVSATSSNGTVYSSNANANGNFQIMGLTAGTYSVTLTPPAPLVAITIPNVVVQTGAATTLNAVVFGP